MGIRKIVLGTVTVLVTMATTLVFNFLKIFNFHRLYYQITDMGNPILCGICFNVFKCTQENCNIITRCIQGDTTIIVSTLYTKRTINGIVCLDPTYNFQIINRRF